MRTMILLGCLAMGISGCAHKAVYDGGQTSALEGEVRVFVPPFVNATEDDHAGRGMTELTVA
ncbi:MAG: hypothetical protein FJ405_14120 [Verrucomicrobia bacterium]|nr:hypothetical protein [Verrucomicrobiota bacterium]